MAAVVVVVEVVVVLVVDVEVEVVVVVVVELSPPPPDDELQPINAATKKQIIKSIMFLICNPPESKFDVQD